MKTRVKYQDNKSTHLRNQTFITGWAKASSQSKCFQQSTQHKRIETAKKDVIQ